jgi:kynurenine formamidase
MITRAHTVHDLSFPVRQHFRWDLQSSLTQSLERGDLFDTTRISCLCHAFTHADAPSHIEAGAAVLGDLPLQTWVGEAALIDVSDVVGAGTRIDEHLLAERGGHLEPGCIALLRTSWDRRASVDTEEYWSASPYVSEGAARWFREREVRCVGFDFPQDEGIRDVVAGQQARPSAFPTHDILLRSGVGLLEYLTGLDRIVGEWTFLVAAPLHLADADGAPVRALAIDFDDHRAEHSSARDTSGDQE